MKKQKANYIKKELQYCGTDVCTCGHSGQAHKSRCVGVTGNNFECKCKCQEYRPKDNLIFLEKKYEEMLKNGSR